MKLLHFLRILWDSSASEQRSAILSSIVFCVSFLDSFRSMYFLKVWFSCRLMRNRITKTAIPTPRQQQISKLFILQLFWLEFGKRKFWQLKFRKIYWNNNGCVLSFGDLLQFGKFLSNGMTLNNSLLFRKILWYKFDITNYYSKLKSTLKYFLVHKCSFKIHFWNIYYPKWNPGYPGSILKSLIQIYGIHNSFLHERNQNYDRILKPT